MFILPTGSSEALYLIFITVVIINQGKVKCHCKTSTEQFLFDFF